MTGHVGPEIAVTIRRNRRSRSSGIIGHVGPEYATNDSTVEKMVELLCNNPRGLLQFRDELMGLFARLDREEYQSDRAFYLEAWNGNGSHTTDRIGRGTIHAPRVCLSLLGGIQPSKLQHYLMNAIAGYENDGLVQRLQLMVYPDPPPCWRLVDRKPDANAHERADRIMRALAAADPLELGAMAEPSRSMPFFRFSREAQELFNAWLTDMEQRLRSDDADIMKQHLGKYRSLMPSLALLFYLITLVDEDQSRRETRGSIPLECAQLAARWCAYLETHARRIYGLSTDPRYTSAKHLAIKISKGHLQDGFSARDVVRKNWAALAVREDVDAALQELADAGWIRRIPQIATGRVGRPSLATYAINPKLFQTDAARTPPGPHDKTDKSEDRD